MSPNPKIPKEWAIHTLDDLCKIHVGKDLVLNRFSPTYDNEHTFPVYSNTVDNQGLYGFYDFAEYEGESLTIIGRGAGLGTAFSRSGGFGAIGRLLVLIPHNSDPVYITNYINSTLKIHKESSGIPQLTGEQIGKCQILLPPLAEQRAIAACLGTWDQGIQLLSRLIAAKERQKKALMQQLLSGRKRLKGFKGKWKEVKLGELFYERIETNRADLPLLSIGQNGVYPQTESNKRDTSNDDKTKYKRICPADIGYNTMRLWQGRCALSQLEGIVSPAYTIVTPLSGVNSLYFSYLFQTPTLINDFWRKSQGLVEDTLNCKFHDFASVKTIIPGAPEQAAIAAVLQTADKELEGLQRRLHLLREQKKGLMQVLLTGKKRMKVGKEKSEIRNAKSGIQNQKHKIRNAKSGK